MRIEDLCKEVPETAAAELSFRPGKEADSSPVTPFAWYACISIKSLTKNKCEHLKVSKLSHHISPPKWYTNGQPIDEKMLDLTSQQGSTSKPQEDSTSHLSTWLLPKRQQRASVRKAAEEKGTLVQSWQEGKVAKPLWKIARSSSSNWN